MFRLVDLAALSRSLDGRPVLSVTIDGGQHDPADRRAWRIRLEHGLTRLEREHPEDAESVARASRHILEALGDHPEFLPWRGWAGFATPEALRSSLPMAVPTPDGVSWGIGMRAAPILRVLKQERAVVVAIADSRRARILEYRNGALEEREDLVAHRDLGDLAEAGASKRARTSSGWIGETATDAAQRILSVERDRMLRQVADRVRLWAGDEGWIVIGGPREVSAALADLFPSGLSARVRIDDGLHLGMSASEISGHVERVASELSEAQQLGWVREVLDAAGAGGRGSLGPDATREALAAGRVDHLLLSRSRSREMDHGVEEWIRLGLESARAVDEVGGGAGELLDANGEGVGARLRW